MLLKKQARQHEIFTKLSENGGVAGRGFSLDIHAARTPMGVSPAVTAVKLGQTLLELEYT